MEHPLKILILEDSMADAELLRRLMQKKMNCEFSLAMDKKSFLLALDYFYPTVILSDNSLPQFNATEALKISREKYPDIPFILVTGTVSEEYAAGIIKAGADDYILKDRVERLPAAITAALIHRRTLKELSDYKFALDQSAIVAFTDQHGLIQYANDNFCKISKYTAEELAGKDHRIINSGYHDKSYIRFLWTTITRGKIWRGEFCNMGKDKSLYWVDATIVPFPDEKGQPYQYLSIGADITERKLLEEELLNQQKNEHLRVTASALEAQEKERNSIAREIHDNVNQLLAAALMQLTMIEKAPDQCNQFVHASLNYLRDAIEENRKIAHAMAAPDLDSEGLVDQLRDLIQNMLGVADIDTILSTSKFREDLLDKQRKLTVYRIAQEQCNNILKYAKARTVNILLSTTDNTFRMVIADDGDGKESGQNTNGIGLRNIKGRLSIFDGTSKIITAPGMGFSLEIQMPLKQQVHPVKA